MNDKYRWLILTQYYPPEVGAPQIRLSSLAKELGRHGVAVDVLTGMPNYPAGRTFDGYKGRVSMRETLGGVPVRRTWVYAATGKSALPRLANYFSFTFSALIAALTGPRPDVMFVESQPLSLGVVGLLMKWLRGVPYVYNVPDLQIDVARQLGFMSNTGFLRLALALENFFLRQSWKVSTVTEQFIQHFEERDIPRSQITFLPNGADGDFLRPIPPDEEMLSRWSLRGKKVFLYVGTHAFYHGLDTLIKAAELLRAREDLVFLLVGDGPERERLKRMAADLGLSNIVFGNSPYEEMDRLYSIAYASVATLRQMDVARGMRLSKIFPSLSCGVPVVYSGQGEAAEILRAEGCGLTVEPERPDLLSQALAALADYPESRAEMGRRGRALVEREYGWSTIVGRWLKEIGVDTSRTSALPIGGYDERPLIESRGRYQSVGRPGLGEFVISAPPPVQKAEQRSDS
jgi:colanic acid biosynthesis glycosyl transferase WcaI